MPPLSTLPAPQRTPRHPGFPREANASLVTVINKNLKRFEEFLPKDGLHSLDMNQEKEKYSLFLETARQHVAIVKENLSTWRKALGFIDIVPTRETIEETTNPTDPEICLYSLLLSLVELDSLIKNEQKEDKNKQCLRIANRIKLTINPINILISAYRQKINVESASPSLQPQDHDKAPAKAPTFQVANSKKRYNKADNDERNYSIGGGIGFGVIGFIIAILFFPPLLVVTPFLMILGSFIGGALHAIRTSSNKPNDNQELESIQSESSTCSLYSQLDISGQSQATQPQLEQKVSENVATSKRNPPADPQPTPTNSNSAGTPYRRISKP